MFTVLKNIFAFQSLEYKYLSPDATLEKTILISAIFCKLTSFEQFAISLTPLGIILPGQVTRVIALILDQCLDILPGGVEEGEGLVEHHVIELRHVLAAFLIYEATSGPTSLLTIQQFSCL